MGLGVRWCAGCAIDVRSSGRVFAPSLRSAPSSRRSRERRVRAVDGGVQHADHRRVRRGRAGVRVAAARALLQGANRNLLGTFLFANLATGAVNVAWDGAMDAGHTTAYVVVAAYLRIAACAIASGADEVAMTTARRCRRTVLESSP